MHDKRKVKQNQKRNKVLKKLFKLSKNMWEQKSTIQVKPQKLIKKEIQRLNSRTFPLV